MSNMKSKETRISMESFQSLLDVITCSRYTNSRNTAVGFHVAKVWKPGKQNVNFEQHIVHCIRPFSTENHWKPTYPLREKNHIQVARISKEYWRNPIYRTLPTSGPTPSTTYTY